MSSQIGGNGWTTSQYWKYGSAGPGGTRHNCTTYAAYRLQRNGFAFPGWTDNANKWAADAHSHGVTVNQIPVVGSIAQWNNGYGHVAYVETVTATYIITTSDSYGTDSKGRSLGTDRLQIARNSPYMPDNFIHFKDTSEAIPTPTATPLAPGTYHAGRQVTIDKHATGGVSGHKGAGNSYAAGPTRPANSALWIACYVTGQSIKGPYDTTTMWDLSDDGYYYTDAWLYTGTNGAAVPHC